MGRQRMDNAALEARARRQLAMREREILGLPKLYRHCFAQKLPPKTVPHRMRDTDHIAARMRRRGGWGEVAEVFEACRG